MRERPTGDVVRAYRDEHECSAQEAVAAVSKQWRRDCLQDIRLKSTGIHTISDCREVIQDTLNLLEVLVERGQ